MLFPSRHFRPALLPLVACMVAAGLAAQAPVIPLKNWPAPWYWQPSPREQRRADRPLGPEPAGLYLGTGAITPPLVFVGMTPCRVMDTRSGTGFTGYYGPPSIAGGTSRTVLMQASSCGIPAIAQAYSFNVTVVPPAGAPMWFLTIWPSGEPQPTVSTLNDGSGQILANAAVVAAGTGGNVDIYVTNTTDVILDINGYYASPTDYNANTALGNGALESNTGGFGNTASGWNALLSNASGGYNTATGYDALASNYSGKDNTASGAGALEFGDAGDENTASGHEALQYNTGNSNTASGYEALQGNTTGNFNIAMGYLAAHSVSNGNSNNIHIGSPGTASDSGTIRIGTSGTQASFFAAGVSGVTTGLGGAVNVVVDANGQLGTISSSRRYKEDIADMGDASSHLLQLRPVTFRYKKPYADGSKPLDYGLLAEEVADVYPDLVVRGKDGQVETVQYQKLTPMLLNELQKEHQQVQQQSEEIRLLQTRLAALEQLLPGKVPAPAGR